MVTGASTADLAVILVDARKGVLTQTRRHSYLVSLLGIRQVVLAVNKMDLVEYSAGVFAAIEDGLPAVRTPDRPVGHHLYPRLAVAGDNVVARSERTPWYRGPCLLEHLETVPLADEAEGAAFRMPVQWVNRPSAEFRGFAGMIASGGVRRGDLLRVLPSGRRSAVARILVGAQDVEAAVAPQSVTLTLADEIDVSRGDVLCAADVPPAVANQFEATIVWMHDEPLLQGQRVPAQNRHQDG